MKYNVRRLIQLYYIRLFYLPESAESTSDDCSKEHETMSIQMVITCIIIKYISKGGVQKKTKNFGIFQTSPDPPTHPPTLEKKNKNFMPLNDFLDHLGNLKNFHLK